MGILASISKRITSAFAPPRPAAAPDRIVEFLSGWQRSNTVQNNTYYRAELSQQFRGWAYVAIDARSAEMACLTPKVSRIVDGDEVANEHRKSLRQAKSLEERDDIRATHRRRFLSKSLKRKALANLQDGDELEIVSSHHPLVKLLKRPNNHDVAYTFSYRLEMYMRLAGVTYIWTVPNRMGIPVQAWVLPPAWVKEFPTDVNGRETEKLIGSYEIAPITTPGVDYGMGWFGGSGGKRRVDEAEIIKIAYPNPMSLTDSWSPMQATAPWTDASNAIDSARVQTFYNGAFPGVVLQLDKDVAAPDQSDLIRIKEKFEEKAAGVRNTRKSYVLAPGMTLAPYGQTAVEMDYCNSFTQSRDSQLAAHRTGPTIAGITEQTSFAADTAARQGFYHGTLRPDLKLIGEVLTERLATRFEEAGEELVIWWEDPTPDDPQYKLDKAKALDAMAANTPNEIREAFGDEPFEYGGDNPSAAMGRQELPWKTGEVSGMPGMDGGSLPTEGGGGQQQSDGTDPLDSVMSQLLGGDGAAESSPGIPSPLVNRMTNGATNGNGKSH